MDLVRLVIFHLELGKKKYFLPLGLRPQKMANESPARPTQGHYLNKVGSTQAPDAAYQVSRSSAFWFRRRRFVSVFTIYWHGGHIGHVLTYYQVCSNNAPGLTLTYFMARSNLVPYAFVWEKVKTMDFSENIVVYDIKVGRCSQLNWYMML